MDVDKFLGFLFPAVNLNGPDEAVCIAERVTGDGDGAQRGGWRHTRWRPGTLPEPLGQHYFCISTVAAPARAQRLRRRAQDLVRTWLIGLDDVGRAAHSKVDPDVIPARCSPPSLVVETSPNNHQYLYALEPACAPERAAALIKALAMMGYTDPAATGANRVLRLPGSLNDKYGAPFRARVVS